MFASRCASCLKGTLKEECAKCHEVRCCRCLEDWFLERTEGRPVCCCGHVFERAWLLRNFGERYVKARDEERVTELVMGTQEVLGVAKQDLEWAGRMLEEHLPGLERVLRDAYDRGEEAGEAIWKLDWKEREISLFYGGFMLFKPAGCYVARNPWRLVQHRDYENWDLVGEGEGEKWEGKCPGCRVEGRGKEFNGVYFCDDCGTTSVAGIQTRCGAEAATSIIGFVGAGGDLFSKEIALDVKWRRRETASAKLRLSSKVWKSAMQFMSDEIGPRERRSRLKEAEMEYQFDLEVIRLVGRWRRDVGPFYQVVDDEKREKIALRIIQEKTKVYRTLFDATELAYFN